MLNPMLEAWSSLAFAARNVAPFQFGPPLAPAKKMDAGQFFSKRFDTDSGSLHYKSFIPDACTGAPLPLIVMLHGCGQDAADFADGTGMNALAEKFHCLVAYPEQPHSANGARCWNWFEEDHHRRGQGEPALIAGIAPKSLPNMPSIRRACASPASRQAAP